MIQPLKIFSDISFNHPKICKYVKYVNINKENSERNKLKA